MQRRKFIQQSLLAGGALFNSGNIVARCSIEGEKTNAKPFDMNYAIHDGMFKNHAGAYGCESS